MWNATIIMDMYQWFIYTRISLFKIEPFNVTVSFPNYLVAKPAEA